MAEREESLLLHYLDCGTLPKEELEQMLPSLTREGELFPVLYGASNRGIGIEPLMQAMVTLLPPPPIVTDGPVSGVSSALSAIRRIGRIAYVSHIAALSATAIPFEMSRSRSRRR